MVNVGAGRSDCNVSPSLWLNSVVFFFFSTDDISMGDAPPLLAAQSNLQAGLLPQPSPFAPSSSSSSSSAPVVAEEAADVSTPNQVRPNALHLHGVDDMSTEDVMAYFEGFAPQAVEWI